MDIEVDQARVGMALSQDVTDPEGNILLQSGASLTESHLDLIRAHGIEQIRVAASEPPSEHAEILPQGTGRLFRHLNREHPLIQELKRIHRSRQLHTEEDD